MKMKDKKILSFVCAFMLLFTTLFSDLCLISSGVYAAVAEDEAVTMLADENDEESTSEEFYLETQVENLEKEDSSEKELVENTTTSEFTIDYNKEETVEEIEEDVEEISVVTEENTKEEDTEQQLVLMSSENGIMLTSSSTIETHFYTRSRL